MLVLLLKVRQVLAMLQKVPKWKVAVFRRLQICDSVYKKNKSVMLFHLQENKSIMFHIFIAENKLKVIRQMFERKIRVSC